MASGTKRQQQALETKNKLIDAALRVFSRKGFSGSTTKDIAKEAGVTDGLIYHYFRSKEDLLWAVLDRYTLLHGMKEELDRLDDSAPLERQLQHYCRSLFRSLHRQQDLIVMCLGEAGRNPEIRERLENLIRKGADLLQAYLLPRVAADPHELAVAIRNLHASAVFYFLMKDRIDHNEQERNQYIDISVSQFLKALQ